MFEYQKANQIWLLAYKNSLNDKFGKEFFRQIPQLPGVYQMLGNSDEILYIGKAKNLRNRLKSYRQAKPDTASRKTLRMIQKIVSIRWEICESEEKALLRENELLRLHQPPFNIVNTYPEMYFFIGFKREKSELSFCLTHEEDLPEFQLFGTFKGRGVTREGYACLLRLLWACLSPKSNGDQMSRFEFPGPIVRHRVPYHYTFKADPGMSEEILSDWERRMSRFLRGTSRTFLDKITETLLGKDAIPPFLYHFIQVSLEGLESFYKYGPLRNSRLRRFHGLKSPLLAQDQIDDLLVTYKLR